MQDQREPTVDERAEQLFAERMRELRDKIGMTQAGLAQKLADDYGIKLDASAITRIELRRPTARTGKELWVEGSHRSGPRAIRLGEAVAIAQALGSTLASMLRPKIPYEDELRLAQQRLADAEAVAQTAAAALAMARHELESVRAKAIHEISEISEEDDDGER